MATTNETVALTDIMAASPGTEASPYLPSLTKSLQDGNLDWQTVSMSCCLCQCPILIGAQGQLARQSMVRKRQPERAVILPCGHILGKKCFDSFIKERRENFRRLWDPEPQIVGCPVCKAAVSYDCSATERVNRNWHKPRGVSLPCPFTLPRTEGKLSRIALPSAQSLAGPCGHCQTRVLTFSLNFWLNTSPWQFTLNPCLIAVTCVRNRSKDPSKMLPMCVAPEYIDPKAVFTVLHIMKRWQDQQNRVDSAWNGTLLEWVDMTPLFFFTFNLEKELPIMARIDQVSLAVPNWEEIEAMDHAGHESQIPDRVRMPSALTNEQVARLLIRWPYFNQPKPRF